MLITFFKNWRARRHHDRVIQKYGDFAASFGDGISYAYIGDPCIPYKGRMRCLKSCYHILDELEEAYALLGYRIVELDRWIERGGYGKSVDDVWLVMREEGERPRFTKDDEQDEIPVVGDLYRIIMETGQAHTAVLNEDGEYEYRPVDDKETGGSDGERG